MIETAGTATTGNPAPTTPAATTGQTATTAPAPWYGNDLDPATTQWVQAKNIPDARSALTSYHNLEKLLGAEKAGRALVPPRDDAPPEEWSAFYGKIGRPETVDGYKLGVPEGQNGDFAKTAATWFHEANVTNKQAETLASKWNEFNAQHVASQEQKFQAEANADVEALKREWGPSFEPNVELARRAAREAGLPQDKAQAIERAIGLAQATKLFAHFGEQYRESPIKGGEGAAAGRFAASPESAKAEIAQLRMDQSFATRLTSNDTAAIEKWNALHKLAFSA